MMDCCWAKTGVPYREDTPAERLPKCNYDEYPTPLFTAVEQCEWKSISIFLTTGTWPGHFFADCDTPYEQLRTWVIRYYQPEEHDGELNVTKWKRLPLHAALIFDAPPQVIQRMVALFPYALRCADDRGSLPLHLAFRQGASDTTLGLFLNKYPESIDRKDDKGRLPVECTRKNVGGPRPLRNLIIESALSKTQANAEHDMELLKKEEALAEMQADNKRITARVRQLEKAVREAQERERITQLELQETKEELLLMKNVNTLDLQRDDQIWKIKNEYYVMEAKKKKIDEAKLAAEQREQVAHQELTKLKDLREHLEKQSKYSLHRPPPLPLGGGGDQSTYDETMDDEDESTRYYCSPQHRGPHHRKGENEFREVERPSYHRRTVHSRDQPEEEVDSYSPSPKNHKHIFSRREQAPIRMRNGTEPSEFMASFGMEKRKVHKSPRRRVSPRRHTSSRRYESPQRGSSFRKGFRRSSPPRRGLDQHLLDDLMPYDSNYDSSYEETTIR